MERKINRKETVVQISSALTWAVVIIACAWVLKGTEHKEVVNYILLAGALVHLFMLYSVLGSKTKSGRPNE